jgi:deoxycytidine triphosphate deaminase
MKNRLSILKVMLHYSAKFFALARTMEYFRIPRNVLTICLGKSTYARCGIIVNVTPFEPEWEGYDAGILEYHAAASQDLCRRRLCAGLVFRKR